MSTRHLSLYNSPPWVRSIASKPRRRGQAAPVGYPSTETPYYTHTASASVYEATEAPSDGNSVYYVPNGPPRPTAVATTVVTVGPAPASPVAVTTITVNHVETVTVDSNQTPAPPGPQRQINSTIRSTNFRTATVTGYGTWNTSAAAGGSPSSASSSCNTSVAGISTSLDESNVMTATQTTFLGTTTKNVFTQTTLTSIFNGSFTGYGPLSTHTSPQPAELVPRQTCTWVTAGVYGGWCNDWNGDTTVRFSSYETTGNISSFVLNLS